MFQLDLTYAICWCVLCRNLKGALPRVGVSKLEYMGARRGKLQRGQHVL